MAGEDRKARKEAANLRKQLKGAAPPWLVTFGDMMSLLLTFFILLYSVSEIKDKKLYEVVQSFRSFYRQEDIATAGYTLRPLDTIIHTLFDLAMEIPDELGVEGKSKVENEEPEEFEIERPWGDRVEVEYSHENLRLTVSGRVLWKGDRRWSWELSDGARRIVRDIARRIAGGPNRIRIVGHASPLPVPEAIAAASPGLDAQELGWRRARAVARALAGAPIPGGGRLDPARLEVASRGSSDPPGGIDDFRAALERGAFDRVEILLTAEPASAGELYRRMAGARGGAPR